MNIIKILGSYTYSYKLRKYHNLSIPYMSQSLQIINYVNLSCYNIIELLL